MSKQLGVKEGMRLLAKAVFCPGESRHQLKEKIRAQRQQAKQRITKRQAAGEITLQQAQAELKQLPSVWAAWDGKIRSHTTLEVYWPIWDRYTTWARRELGIRKWVDLQARKTEIAEQWMQEQFSKNLAPSTLLTYRSALKILHQDQKLFSHLKFPRRNREAFTRSRGPAKRDLEFQPSNYPTLLEFQKAVGFRCDELHMVRVQDVQLGSNGRPVAVSVKQGKGGKFRRVSLTRAEQARAVAHALEEARLRQPNDQTAKLFKRIPDRLDAHGLRREWTQQIYQQLSGRDLPPKEGRLRKGILDGGAASQIAVWLGHGPQRIETVSTHYLR